MKFLRLAHIDEVQDAFKSVFDRLGDVFYLQRYMLQNLNSWFLAGLKFLLCIHYFACGWKLIYTLKDSNGLQKVEFVETSLTYRYIESFYLITTTITTVGYGDYKGFNNTDPVWRAEMCYLYVVTLIGTLLFSSVTNQIFNYHKLETVNEIVSKTKRNMEEYLYNVSKVRSNMFLGEDRIKTSLRHMEEFIRGSTRFHFE